MIQFYTYSLYVYTYFLYSFPSWFMPGYEIYPPVLYSSTMLLIHPVCTGLHLLTLNSQSIPPPSPPGHWSLSSVSVSLENFCFRSQLWHTLTVRLTRWSSLLKSWWSCSGSALGSDLEPSPGAGSPCRVDWPSPGWPPSVKWGGVGWNDLWGPLLC